MTTPAFAGVGMEEMRIPAASVGCIALRCGLGLLNPRRIFMRRRNAFTLVELLVVIGIIALLVGILLPALGRRPQASDGCPVRSNCATPARSVCLLMPPIIKATFLSFLRIPFILTQTPVDTGCGIWKFRHANALVHYGVTQEASYCPTNADTQSELSASGQDPWNFASIPLKPPGSIGYGILGYVWLTTRPEGIIGGAPAPRGVTANYNTYPNNTLDNPSGPLYHWDYQSKLRPKNTYNNLHTILRPPISSDTEIVMDPILSQNKTPPYNFSPKGGFTTPQPRRHLYGTVPDGGNILFMDGHVDWRPFSQMHLHAFCGQGTGNPYFWW